jgi:hypothetical protein
MAPKPLDTPPAGTEPAAPVNAPEQPKVGDRAVVGINPDPDKSQQTITTKVWAAQGQVPKASVLQTAIQSVRDAIPVVFELEAEITGTEKKDNEGQPGTEFEVTATAGKLDEVDVDKVIRGLDVPRSFDGIAGHDGDPDFLERKPAELR